MAKTTTAAKPRKTPTNRKATAAHPRTATRNDFLNIISQATSSLYVEAFKRNVRYRPATMTEMAGAPDDMAIGTFLIICCVIDDDDNNLFTLADAAMIDRLPPVGTADLLSKLFEINGMSPEVMEEAEKNLLATG